MSWSDILREDLQLVDMAKACIYCGSTENIQNEHIVPRSIKINERYSGRNVLSADLTPDLRNRRMRQRRTVRRRWSIRATVFGGSL